MQRGRVGMQESGALHHKYRAKFCGQTSRKSSFRYRKAEHYNAVPRFICFIKDIVNLILV